MTNTTFTNATITNATALSTTISSDENIVIWQSALWALLALALNAMTQPSDADPSPTSAISLVRSSPLICCLDAISILAWLGVGCIYGESATNSLASKRIATHSDRAPARTPIFSPTTSAVFFILGPLPQAIKLASMTNVPFTQVFGLIFLVAYLLGVYEAGAVHRATHRHTENPSLSFAVKAQRIPETIRNRLTGAAKAIRFHVYFCHVSLWLALAHMVVYTSRGTDKVGLDRFLGSTSLLYYQYPIIIVAFPVGLYAKYYLGDWLHERYSGNVGPHRMRPMINAGLLYGPAVLSSLLAFALVIFFFQLIKNSFHPEQDIRLGWKAYAETKHSFVDLLGFLLVILVLAICIPLITFGIFLAKTALELRMALEPEVMMEVNNKDESDRWFYNMIMQGFGLCNLLFAILFYAYVYIAEGTSKPGWSEMLG